jgi:hypothetical protein
VNRRPIAVDEAAARAVAAHYLADDGRTDRSLVRAAWDQLAAQTDLLLGRMLDQWPWGALRLAPTSVAEPYATDDELISAVRRTGVLEIPRVEGGRCHPLLGDGPGGEYDRFRALHDLVGHVLPGYGFDRNGEYSAWRAQHRHYRGLARWALATELHAHHSVRWTTGELAEAKALLLDPQVLRTSFQGGPP